MSTPDPTSFLPLWGDQFSEENVAARARANAADLAAPRTIDPREGSHLGIVISLQAREVHRLADLAGYDIPASAFPLWAWGDYLDDHAELQQVFRLASTPAAGLAVFTAAVGTLIPAGTEVGVPPTDQDAAAPSFMTDSSATVQGPLATPPQPLGFPSAAGGAMATGTYYYVYTALDAAGETPPSPQRAVAVVGPTGSVTLSWPPIVGATGYRIWRGPTGGPYSLLATVTSSTYTDIGGATSAPTPPVANTTGGKVGAPITAVEEGASSRVAAGAITEMLSPLADVDVTNPAPTLGGSDPEDDDALRERLLAAYEGKGAGSARDYRRWARSYPGVGRAKVIPLWNGPGTVRVIVTDVNGDPVSDVVVQGLQAMLDPVLDQAEGEAPVGARVTVSTATALGLTIAGTIEFDPGYSLDGSGGTTALQTAIQAAVDAYVNLVQPGEEVVQRRVVAAIVNVPGVHDAGSVVLSPGALGNGNVLADDDPPQSPYVATYTLVAGSV